jgi:hypothetical protein
MRNSFKAEECVSPAVDGNVEVSPGVVIFAFA